MFAGFAVFLDVPFLVVMQDGVQGPADACLHADTLDTRPRRALTFVHERVNLFSSAPRQGSQRIVQLLEWGNRDVADIALIHQGKGGVRQSLDFGNQAEWLLENCRTGINPRPGRIDRGVLEFGYGIGLALGRIDERDDIGAGNG